MIRFRRRLWLSQMPRHYFAEAVFAGCSLMLPLIAARHGAAFISFRYCRITLRHFLSPDAAAEFRRQRHYFAAAAAIIATPRAMPADIIFTPLARFSFDCRDIFFHFAFRHFFFRFFSSLFAIFAFFFLSFSPPLRWPLPLTVSCCRRFCRFSTPFQLPLIFSPPFASCHAG
jgi:hypothetical protein